MLALQMSNCNFNATPNNNKAKISTPRNNREASKYLYLSLANSNTKMTIGAISNS